MKTILQSLQRWLWKARQCLDPQVNNRLHEFLCLMLARYAERGDVTGQLKCTLDKGADVIAGDCAHTWFIE